jgi:hypothetical protein
MPLPVIFLVTSAREALKHWRSLPPPEREQLRETAMNARRLAVELAGPRAQQLLGDESGEVVPTAATRDRDEVVRELRASLAVLSAAAGAGAAETFGGRSRKGRAIGKIAGVGARQVRKRVRNPAAPQPERPRAAPGDAVTRPHDA